MNDSTERQFSVGEANAWLPELRRLLPQMQAARDTVLRHGEHIRRSARRNGGGKEGSEYWDAVSLLRRETERLSGDGLVLRDIDGGLIDFPAEREGLPGFLCWRIDEPEISFWHPVDTGFAGRRPL